MQTPPISLTLPECPHHSKQITHLCSCSTCKIPNPMICSEPECLKLHAHPLQQIIAVDKLKELLERNTASMDMLIARMRDYYREVREWFCHEVSKMQDMMVRSLGYRHTHPVISLFAESKYSEITPQRMFQLTSYLRGAKTQRKSMQSIKNQIYQWVQKIQAQKSSLVSSQPYKSLLLMALIDQSSTFQLTMQSINTSILDSEQEFQTIMKMIQSRSKKNVTGLELLYRGSDHGFSAGGYLLAVEGRGPLLMSFRTSNDRKFGGFVNCKVEKKEGWVTDGPGFSFIYSLDHDMMYPIKQEAKYRVKALYLGQKGPQIGAGCDIYISDKCNQNNQSGSNLGGSFQLPKKLVYGSRQAKQHLAGQQNFTITQYQIYEVK